MSFVPIKQYNNNQIILNSDRLVFNTKADDIIISSKRDVSITLAGAFHVNIGASGKQNASTNFFILNAPKIQFGMGDVEPVTKANSTAILLNSLLNALTELSTNLISATGIGVGTINEPTINAAGIKLQGQIKNIISKVDTIKSTVTFTS